ncbi:Secreted subtilisin-like serine protease sub5 [Myotisia sp. PD_48]|nr:Secreted subtilisin-like serine protease sub5 [Myotisia sp. PD_48]
MGIVKYISVALAATSATHAAQILAAPKDANVIPDAYIVVMKENVSERQFSAHRSWVSDIHHNLTRRGLDGEGVKHTYDFQRMKGYSGVFDRDTIRDIANDPNVKYVERDSIITIDAITEQPNAPSWGLGRVSNRARGSRNYVYDDSAGAGVWMYDVDTGVDINHSEFTGRAVWGSNHVDSSNRDGHGHGTHVGGTMGGTSYGIAKKAKIIAVKVLDDRGSGSISGIVAGINWSVNNARQNNVLAKSVMNMSLGGGSTASLNQAAAQAVSAGMFVAVAAGNDNRDARNSSPASEPTVCTVASSAENDTKSSFSNFGSVIDIYAPGSNIISARPGGGSTSMSGTSMASPHVAGVGAYLIGLEGISGDAVCSRIKALGQAAVSNPGSGTTNKLLYNGSGR